MRERGTERGLPFDFDSVRRDAIRKVEEITERRLIVYAVDITNLSKSPNPVDGMINPQDRDALIEVTRNIEVPGGPVDIFLQSNGGLAEAAETLVEMLRRRFTSVRFIVVGSAKSAATMLALSGDEILMTTSSELGPTDPQMGIGGGRFAPAQAVLDLFDRARRELMENPQAMPAWLPILQQFGPALLQECQNQLDLGRALVTSWLTRFMFADDPTDGPRRAAALAESFSQHNKWGSHSRRIGLEFLTSPDGEGLKVTNVEENQALHEALWALHHAINVTFSRTPTLKIIERSSGEAYIRGVAQVSLMPQGFPFPAQPFPIPMQPLPTPVQPAPAQPSPEPSIPPQTT